MQYTMTPEVQEIVARNTYRVLEGYTSTSPNPLKPWSEASEGAKTGYRSAVKLVIEEGYTSQQLHEKWMADKTEAGWEFGEEKDEELKTHPNLVEYENLPESERVKDTIFRAAAISCFVCVTGAKL